MKRLSLALAISGGLTAAMLGWRVHTAADDRVRPIPDTLEADTPAVSTPLMMQTKLTALQRVLEGLLHRDFETIASSANLLQQISRLPDPRRGQSSEDEVYDHFRTEFQRLTVQLNSMAEQENLEGAAYVQQSLTATCLACHSHLRDHRPD